MSAWWNVVKWDNVSSPNNRFKQHDISWPVPDIGLCAFRYIKSKKKSEVVIFLPERYFLKHELENEDKIMEELAWQALTWFGKNAMKLKRRKARRHRIGFGLLDQYRPTHYAFQANTVQQNFIKKHGMLKTKTDDGEAWLDDSLKDVGEVEYTNCDEALISLDMPMMDGLIAQFLNALLL